MKTLAVLLLLAEPLLAQQRPVNTFSIVARDEATGEIGVAVQSHWFAVGQIVPWAEAGVGAVATQSFVDPSYGKLGLDLLRAGKAAPDALRALLGGDSACDVRQVAMIDARGTVATFTGARDIAAAGGIAGDASGSASVLCGTAGGMLATGRGFAVQANMMANERSLARDGEGLRGGEGRSRRPDARGARRRAGGRGRHPREAVGGPHRGEARNRPAAPGRTASSTFASTIIRGRSTSCGASSRSSAPTTT